MNRTLESIAKGIVAMMMLGSVSLSAQQDWIDATHAFEEEVRAVVSTVELETRKEHAARTRTVETRQNSYKIGDIEKFWTKNIVDNTFETTPAVLRAIGKNCYIFVEEGKAVSPEAIEKIKKSFDENIYPTNTGNFGFEWKPGIDGDNRITLLMFDIKDGYNGSGGFVGGYFYAVDSYLQDKLPAHLKSNEREMFYLDINPADPTSDRYMATIAHEFQHMIHFNHDSSELTWVNESCSQIAPYLCGFGHASQISSFMKTPDNSLTAWAKDQMLANYGQVYLWNYYIFNSYLREVPAARSAFFKNLVASKKLGLAGVSEALATVSKSFTQTFDQFCIANFINDSRLSNGKYAYDNSLARLKLPVSETVSAFPAQIEGGVFLWSADAVKIDLSSAREEIEINFSGFRGKMGEDLTNTFSVALVMSDSRGQAEPKISFLDFTSFNGQLQGGVMKTRLESTYDTAMVIIIAQAPEEIDERIYVKAQPMKYTLKIKDLGAPVARERAVVDVRNSIAHYAEVASGLGGGNEAATMIALEQLETARAQITAELSSQIENRNYTGIELVAEMIENGEVSRVAINPLIEAIIHIARFNAIAADEQQIESLLKSLR